MYKFMMTIFILLFILTGCDEKENNTTQSKTKTDTNTIVAKSNKATSDIKFNLKTIDGKEFHLTEIDNGLEFKEIKNKAIFLLFFGHRCPPCLREIPHLIEMQKEH
ncbi:MAG: hypothetical protein KAU90_04740, partial [Sulfurovaceae bacterium]|nr:hypothetical protein [Sulfurovaceae bacterium]